MFYVTLTFLAASASLLRNSDFDTDLARAWILLAYFGCSPEQVYHMVHLSDHAMLRLMTDENEASANSGAILNEVAAVMRRWSRCC